ncbi:ricin-type beta-trefoil lectin domain protein [Kitasatospora sp. CMC57]
MTPTPMPTPKPTGPHAYNGKATYFYTDGVAGACGELMGDGDLGVALDYRMFRLEFCGRKVVVSHNGKSVTATVLDSNPASTGTQDLDLTLGAFDALASRETSAINVSWGFVESNLNPRGGEYYIRSNKYPEYTMQPKGTPYAGDSVVIGYTSSPFDELIFSKGATGMTIKEADSGLCLDPDGYVSKAKARLEVYPCSGSADQKFSIDPGDAGGTGMKSVRIRHDISGLCLSVFESSTSAEPTWIGLDTCSRTSINQKFAIIA